MRKIAVFASGNGSNFEAIAKACIEGVINAELCCLVCDKKDAYVIERAKKYNIPSHVFSLKKYGSKEAYEEAIVEKLSEYGVEYIFLAGYMKICGNVLLNKYSNKIINIHPALLPAFKGAHAILDAYNYGVKVYGVTIHYVNNEIDGGKIIMQDVIDYQESDTLDEIETKIHALEHKLYVKAIKKILEEENESSC